MNFPGKNEILAAKIPATGVMFSEAGWRESGSATGLRQSRFKATDALVL